MDVKSSGDHFGVDLGIIPGLGIISKGCTDPLFPYILTRLQHCVVAERPLNLC